MAIKVTRNDAMSDYETYYRSLCGEVARKHFSWHLDCLSVVGMRWKNNGKLHQRWRCRHWAIEKQKFVAVFAAFTFFIVDCDTTTSICLQSANTNTYFTKGLLWFPLSFLRGFQYLVCSHVFVLFELIQFHLDEVNVSGTLAQGPVQKWILSTEVNV